MSSEKAMTMAVGSLAPSDAQEDSESTEFRSYFKCPAEFGVFKPAADIGIEKGFFRFGDCILYGRATGPVVSDRAHAVHDVELRSEAVSLPLVLPFEAGEIARNLRFEYYSQPGHHAGNKFVRDFYYWLRPVLPVTVRKHLQRLHLRGRLKIGFPQWPIDRTVDRMFEKMMIAAIGGHNCEIPFIWFWPDENSSCCIVTHDVEGKAGLDASLDLMKVDSDHGIKASFQFIPEGRYVTPPKLRSSIEDAGFEVNVHDLNHDGSLFVDRVRFRERAAKINQYGAQWGAEGFRAGAMYRNLDWMRDLTFSYDMSVPNAAHLEPQYGGCCTVMPFFVDSMVELPLTLTQDYTLFHVLNENSTCLWEQQLEEIGAHYGLSSLNTHPDYLLEQNARTVYVDLLRSLAKRFRSQKIWNPLPRELAKWWKQRSKLELRLKGGRWTIVGPGAEKASIAHAYLADGELQYRFQSSKSS